MVFLFSIFNLKQKDKTVKTSIKLVQKICVVALLLVSGFTYAAGEIVAVDTRTAILRSDKGILAAEKLRALIEKDKATLIVIEEGLKKLKEKMDKDGAVMSVEERSKLEQTANSKMADYQHEGKKLQQVAKEEEQRLFKSILPDFEKAIKSLMEEKQYGMVFRSEAVILVSPDKDITADVVARMNQK